MYCTCYFDVITDICVGATLHNDNGEQIWLAGGSTIRLGSGQYKFPNKEFCPLGKTAYELVEFAMLVF